MARRKTKGRRRRKHITANQIKMGGAMMVKAPFPVKWMRSHGWNTTATMSGAGVSTTGVSANSIFEPIPSGTDASYFSNLSSQYDKWCVVGAVIKATFMNSGSNTVPVRCAILLDDNSTLTPSSMTNICASADSRSGFLLPGESKLVLTQSYSLKKRFGKGNVSDPAYSGSGSTRPTTEPYFYVACSAMDGSSTTQYCVIQVIYRVLWQNRNVVTTIS